MNVATIQSQEVIPTIAILHVAVAYEGITNLSDCLNNLPEPCQLCHFTNVIPFAIAFMIVLLCSSFHGVIVIYF